MHRERQCRRLERSARHRIAILSRHLESISANTSVQDCESIIARSTIDLLNTWSNFCRSFYLSCMMGCRSNSGVRIQPPVCVSNINDAVGLAVRLHNPHATPNASGIWHRRTEPPWHDTSFLLRLFQHQSISNRVDVGHALSAGSRAFLDLPVFRNYFGHRNQSTADATRARALLNSVAPQKRPSDILLSRAVGRHQPLIDDWLSDIDFTIEYMCN